MVSSLNLTGSQHQKIVYDAISFLIFTCNVTTGVNEQESGSRLGGTEPELCAGDHWAAERPADFLCGD